MALHARYDIAYTPAHLVLEWQVEKGWHHITLTGDRVKTLYEGADAVLAKRTWTEVRDMYEARRAQEAG